MSTPLTPIGTADSSSTATSSNGGHGVATAQAVISIIGGTATGVTIGASGNVSAPKELTL